MKKSYTLLLLLLLFSISIGAFAQYQYQPFPSQKGLWVYKKYSDNYSFLGYNSKEYVLDTTDGYMKNLDVWYYEQNKQIYFKYDTGSFKLVYDFNLTVGDTFYVPNYNAPTGTPWQTFTTVMQDDSVSVNWPGRRVIEFANGGQWVEGIGLVNDAWGIEYSFMQGSLSGASIFNCISSDSVSYPCANANVLNIDEIPIEQGFSISPNPIQPTTQNLTIELSLPNLQNTTATVRLYNMAGQVVLKREVQFVEGKTTLVLSPIREGGNNFVLELKTETYFFIQKIMLQ